MSTPTSFMVCTKCMTFNHHAYIEDAMNGFCMQETNFPFVCVIIDDASTDGEQEVIKKYFDLHFDQSETAETEDYIMTFGQHKTNKNCYFAVFYLKYNHYSIKKSKIPYYSRWQDTCKYIALCEGDDYWIDERKLQMQVDFLEENEEYSMCTHQSFIFDMQKKEQRIYYSTKENSDVQINCFIDFPHTSSYFMRNTKNCGLYKKEDIEYKSKFLLPWDKSIPLFYISIGKIRFINLPMSIYRLNLNGGNWTSMMYKVNKTKIRTDVELGFLKQVKAYGLKVDIKPHFYNNVVLYSMEFFKNNISFSNFKLMLYGWSKCPNKLSCIVFLLKKVVRKIFK